MQDGTKEVPNEEFWKAASALRAQYIPPEKEPKSWQELSDRRKRDKERVEEYEKDLEERKKAGKLPPESLTVPVVVKARGINYERLFYQMGMVVLLAIGAHIALINKREDPT